MLQRLIDHFESATTHDIYNGMKKLDFSYEELKDVIDQFCPEGYTYDRGNFFEHSHPYYPHVDGFENQMNVLIPLRASTAQTFIVFDQTFDRPATWSTNKDLGEFNINKLHRCRPFDDEVIGLVDAPCPIAPFLPGEESFWYGLTGTVHRWLPGVPIRFESNHLHATGKQHAKKLGLSLIFRK